VKDIASQEFSLNSTKFDLVFSKMMAEHVKSGEQFHRNVLQMLAENGLAVHFFPTLYALPFLLNRLAPEVLADKIADLFTPRDKYQHAKFPAYYSWCRGPVRSQLKKYEELGYEVIEYKGFFGHHGYYNRLPFLKRIHELKTDYLLRKPSPLFTSYAYVVLKKAQKHFGRK
jgi:2-polyprenyl-3-methyl-5-hydroxy-6-metoxy-1,4-benzoquinol methylase